MKNRRPSEVGGNIKSHENEDDTIDPTIGSHGDGVVVYTDHDLCIKKSIELLEEFHLPCGLFPLNDLEAATIGLPTSCGSSKRMRQLTISGEAADAHGGGWRRWLSRSRLEDRA
ncbi:hypothetical protein FCM35_KLT20986 [Carex littledalei]|uniref:Uncharacterized protein n=1 Tax=Carex littledalei TaxID=544730 RepID=A0A833R5M6_9POAL|nr:hypothetical protein FCM35_KLT20986 [Carex littledalei]